MKPISECWVSQLYHFGEGALAPFLFCLLDLTLLLEHRCRRFLPRSSVGSYVVPQTPLGVRPILSLDQLHIYVDKTVCAAVSVLYLCIAR